MPSIRTPMDIRRCNELAFKLPQKRNLERNFEPASYIDSYWFTIVHCRLCTSFTAVPCRETEFQKKQLSPENDEIHSLRKSRVDVLLIDKKG